MIGERDDAHNIQGPCEKEAGWNGDDVVFRLREEGHYARYQHELRLHVIATRFDRYREAGSRISQGAPLSDDRIIEGQNDGGTECCRERRERLNRRLWKELGHLESKQAAERTKEKGEGNAP